MNAALKFISTLKYGAPRVH